MTTLTNSEILILAVAGISERTYRVGFDVNLAELNLQDDLNIGDFGVENPGEYQDQLQAAPPREDNYELRITEFRQAKVFGSQTENVYTADEAGHQWPVFEITEIEIVRPQELARKVRLNQKVKTRPFKRQGAAGESMASEFADLLRSFNAQRAWSGIVGEGSNGVPSGLQLLKEFVETGATAKGRGQWRAFDKEYFDTAVNAGGGREQLSQEEMGRIVNKAQIRGMKKFPANSKGGYIPEVVGPSGEKLNAKFYIARFYPSNDTKVKIAD